MRVATVDERTVGMLTAYDPAGTLWLLVLRLKPPTGSGRWRATVGRAVSAETTHSFSEGPAATTFTFAARGSGATRTIENVECSAEMRRSPLRLAGGHDLDAALVELAATASARSV